MVEAAFLDLQAAAEYCGLGVRSLRKLLGNKIAYHRISPTSKILLRREDLDQLMEASRYEPKNLDQIMNKIKVGAR